MPKIKTVKDIVADYLKEHGFDGLYSEVCGCRLEGLISCDDSYCADCQPGYAITCDECTRHDDCEYELEPGTQCVGPRR